MKKTLLCLLMLAGPAAAQAPDVAEEMRRDYVMSRMMTALFPADYYPAVNAHFEHRALLIATTWFIIHGAPIPESYP